MRRRQTYPVEAVGVRLHSMRATAATNALSKKLLTKQKVLTFADFSGKKEADIEDMLDADFYLELVN